MLMEPYVVYMMDAFNAAILLTLQLTGLFWPIVFIWLVIQDCMWAVFKSNPEYWLLYHYLSFCLF